ncbi:hypothetical protein B296_00013351, partial [Ensete ventricosum]
MHPLRFPNSGIRAKVFVRKIGFKLLKAARRRGASPHAGVAAHGQATATTPYKGRLATIRANPKGRPTTPTRGGSRPQGRCLRTEALPVGTVSCGQAVGATAACSTAP